MLTSIELENFRGHTQTKVPLERFTLLVGDNASGKTSVLEAVQLAGRSFSTLPHELFQGSTDLQWLVRRGAAGGMRLAFCGAAGGEPWRYQIRAMGPSLTDRIEAEWLAKGVPGGPEMLHLMVGFANAGPGGSIRLPAEIRTLGHAVLLRLDARRLAEPSTSEEVVPALSVDGYGLATVLNYLKNSKLDRFQGIEAGTRAVVPSLKAFDYERVKLVRQKARTITVEGQSVLVPEAETVIADGLKLLFQGFGESDALPAHAASEGTLLVIGVLAVLHHPLCPKVLLLDEIDRALHPRAQGELVTLLRGVLAANPDVQIIATTHSPYMADHFAPGEVVVCGRPEGGPLVARSLKDHPDQKLLKSMTTGEFLTASGSGWYWP